MHIQAVQTHPPLDLTTRFLVSAFPCIERSEPDNLHMNLENSVDVAMQGAIFRGIYNITTKFDLKCTSSCTWKDSYISLGFASRCQNVTEPTMATVTLSNSTKSKTSLTTPGKVALQVELS